MAFSIDKDVCLGCGACEGECPVGAIHAAVCPADAISEGDGKYVIDADACLDCGACEGICPVGAPKA